MASVYGSIVTKVARIAGESKAMDEVAAKVTAAAQGLAARHRLTGAYASSFTTSRVRGKRGVIDRLVSNHDRAAVSIERGHVASRGGVGPPRFVPGQHIMANAAKQVSR